MTRTFELAFSSLATSHPSHSELQVTAVTLKSNLNCVMPLPAVPSGWALHPDGTDLNTLALQLTLPFISSLAPGHGTAISHCPQTTHTSIPWRPCPDPTPTPPIHPSPSTCTCPCSSFTQRKARVAFLPEPASPGLGHSPWPPRPRHLHRTRSGSTQSPCKWRPGLFSTDEA